MNTERLGDILDRTEIYIRREGYRGYDPYDGLQSPLFNLPVLRKARIPRWGFQQVLKRLPFQTRPLLGIAKGYNPVTLALAIQAYTYRDMAEPANCFRRANEVRRLVTELKRLRSEGFSGSCWGYDFDWEARYARIPAYYPTIVATGFVTNALFIAFRHYDLAEARDLILDAVSFLCNDIKRVAGNDDTFCWTYSPADDQAVLNATLKGARLLAQAVSLGADASLLDDARRTIRYVLAHQRPDGGWPYAIGDTRSWSDHFHTCYNLDCLDEYRSLTGDDRFNVALDLGVKYYLEHFFTGDGIPKYYDESLYPIDATCCGQALLTLMRFGEDTRAGITRDWILGNMTTRSGSFKYQLARRYQNRLPYMRWSTAWLFAGLSRMESIYAQR